MSARSRFASTLFLILRLRTSVALGVDDGFVEAVFEDEFSDTVEVRALGGLDAEKAEQRRAAATDLARMLAPKRRKVTTGVRWKSWRRRY